MSHATASSVARVGDWLHHVGTIGLSDPELLRRAAGERDEAAFAALVERHGPRVWGVCRRTAGDLHLAEDVFQATFLLLIRKPWTVRKPAAIAAWLHGTAYRLAVHARRQGRRRAERERRAAPPLVTPPDDLTTRELFSILDEELNRLPPVYREPLVLCFLEGLTQDDAARRLGISAGSIKGRLERGRARLAQRLKRRGFGPASLLVAPFAAATVPSALNAKTLTLIPVGAAIPASVAELARSATPLGSRLALAATALVLTAALGLGFARLGAEPPAEPAKPAKPAAEANDLEALPPGAIARLGTTRLRPGGSVEFLAFSPDGKRLVSATDVHHTSYDTSVWDVATGRELRRVVQYGTSARAWSWLADGRGATVVMHDWRKPDSLFLWDFATDGAAVPPASNTSREPGMIVGRPDDETDYAFAASPDGKLLAVGRAGMHTDKERAIELREFVPGKHVKDLPLVRRLGTSPENCHHLLFTPDGKTLVSFGQMNNGGRRAEKVLVIVWDVVTGKQRHRLTVPGPTLQGYRPSIAVSNQFLAIGQENEAGTLRLIDLESGRERDIQTGHKSPHPGGGYGVSAVVFTPDGKTIVTGGRDEKVRIWDVAGGKPRLTLSGVTSWIEALAVSPDGKTLAAAGQGGVIRLWNVATGADACPQPGHLGGLDGVAVSSDGRTAITAGRDGTLRVWDVPAAREVRSIPRIPVAGDLSPDGKTLVGGPNGTLKSWDAATGKETPAPGALAGAKADSARFHGERTLITIHEDTVTIWDWPAGTARQTIRLPAPDKQPGKTRCDRAALSPDGTVLVAMSGRSWDREERGMKFGYGADHVVDLCDATTGKHLRRLMRLSDWGRSAAFTADGDLVIQGRGVLIDASGIEQQLTGFLHVIDPLTGRLRRSFEEVLQDPTSTHRYFMALSLSPDGRVAYVADNNGVVTVFEVATGRMRRQLRGHRALLTGLALTGDGKRLLTASLDATALVWEVSCAAAPRPANRPTAGELAKHWGELGLNNAAEAYAGMAALAAAPNEAIALMARNLTPATDRAPDPAMLDRLVTDLASDEFTVRQKAATELDKLGETAVPGLRERLPGVQSPEARKRIIKHLEMHDPADAPPHRLQTLRAIELLEEFATPEAKALLTKLASGAPDARLTREAKLALERLAGGK